MRAVILAGGKGSRLMPYTTLIPKPLMPLGGKYSILEVVIMQLASQGFTHMTLAVNHLSHLIKAYIGDGSSFGVKIDYSKEDKALSTIGPLTLIPDLPENFLVMNGDILCDLNYRAFFDRHVQGGQTVSVSSYRRIVPVDFGVLEYDATGGLTSFREKPELSYEVSMGIYCIHKSVVDSLRKGEPYGFDQLMTDSLAAGRHVSICPFDGFWLDIGRPDDYEAANQDFESLVHRLGIRL